MKYLSWKKIAVSIVAVGLAIAGIFYFESGTGEKTPSTSINPAFAEHISSYTTGVIPSGSSLRIVMSSDMVDSTRVGEESREKLFDFTPSVSGKTVWVDERTVEFRPEDRMTSGKIYTAEFYLSKLKEGLPDPLRTFEFSFQVIPQNFEILIVNTKPYVKTDLKREKIEGSLNTADYAAPPDVEKTVAAQQAGKTLNLTWAHAEDGMQHSFVVEEVSRKQEAGKVGIQINGHPIGIDRVQEMEVDIPGLNEFKLMRSRVVQSPTQHVVLQFSDPVKENQNLNGLVRIADLSSLDFDVHDNEIWVYPPVRQNGTMTLSVATGVKNVLDQRLRNSVSEEVVFEQVKPALRFTGKGSILPGTDGMVVPFEAVNLNAVDVQIIKIHEDNVLQFFQVNNLQSNNELRRVGNRIVRKKISLAATGIADPGKWNRYTLDISRLIQAEPGAIYEVKLGFKRAYSIYSCEAPEPGPEMAEQFESADEASEDGFDGAWSYDYYEDYYPYGENFDWRQRENPCNDSYYTSDKSVTKNILASDLGLTVKRGGDGNTLVFVTDLMTAQPLSGVEVTLYSFQLQALSRGVTDKEGTVSLNSKEVPFAMVAENGSERGYLRLINGESLLVSSFDVSGEVVHKGLKGFLYGERGVWRPGDSLYLSFILEDKRKLLPANHPVVFELSNPQGQVMQRIVRSTSENGFYRFATATTVDAPTGNWLGTVKVGGTTFTETLKIETVKPNRLKINLDFGTEKFTSPEVDGVLEVKWLHGAPGRNLKAEFDVLLVRQPTRFPQFPDYYFDDPSREFQSESQLFFEGSTDSEGKAIVAATLDVAGSPSGLLSAVFRGKVFEESGNFSIDRFSIPLYPYESFVGMRLPEGERYSGILYTDTPQKVGIATVDTEGSGVSKKGIEVNMYKLQWRWWWDNSNESLANFVEGSYARLVRNGSVNTVNGKGEWTFNLPAAEYGRYFVRACDPVSGHCSGQIVYVDEPGWYSRARADDARGGANLLSFSTDKTSYNIGEKINLTIPGSPGGRAMVSVENGSKVLQTYWVETQQGETPFALDVIPEMAPNVYIHVSLLQPHAQTENDQPLRLYGVSGIQVENPATHLEPVITMPDVLVP
ncbi:MAG: MG2 domain-containing protein, partial [Cyclobacteriaceae bacterium]